MTMPLKRLAILGSTGSIGRQTLEVVTAYPDRFRVVGLAAGRNAELFEQQVERFQPRAALLTRRSSAMPVLSDPRLVDLATDPEVDVVVVGTPGLVGLGPTIAALQAGKLVALANKEVLVAAGELVIPLVRASEGGLLPIDSEHSAIWQCLRGEAGGPGQPAPLEIDRLVLTASGGPFRNRRPAELARVTVAEALAHPTWTMGPKVTIDSATLMNKGFEVIEAHWLFGVPYDRIDVVVHPQSIVHSMVQFVDGSTKAQLGPPDMRLPILYSLMYPERPSIPWPRLDFRQVLTLGFEPADRERFPALALAEQAGRAGGTYPAVLNGADDEAVRLFLTGQIGFTDIPALTARVLGQHDGATRMDVDTILAADAWARQRCRDLAIDLAAVP